MNVDRMASDGTIVTATPSPEGSRYNRSPAGSRDNAADFLHRGAEMQSETLFDYVSLTFGRDGSAYLPRACVAETSDRRCRVWIEFVPVGRGPVLRSALETIRDDRRDAAAWALSLSSERLATGVNEARHWASV